MALAAAALVLAGAAAGARAESGPVVVELFTSQACGSCPPADRLVADLAREDGVLALSFHVGYWDYTGWKDPYAIPEATERQRAYGQSLHKRYVYTPQIFVDGETEIPGSRLEALRPAVEAARGRDKLAIAVAYNAVDGVAQVRIPAANHAGAPADIWVAIFDRAQTTSIKAGENKGRRLTSANVVRVFQRLGGWHGAEMTLTLPLQALGGQGHDACAILVQETGYGAILGARAILLRGRSS